MGCDAPAGSVEVGLVGPDVYGRYAFLAPAGIDQPRELPWSLRLRATVVVAENTTLATVIDSAAAEFGVRLRPEIYGDAGPSSAIDRVGFVFSEVDSPRDTYSARGRFLGIASDGKLTCGPIDAIAVASLIRASDAGLIVGDPRRIYFIPSPPGGDILGVNWEAAVDALRLAFEAIGAAQITKSAGRAIRVRIMGVRQTLIQQAFQAARETGAGPAELWRLIGALDRDGVLDAKALSQLLSISGECAAELLWLCGYDQRGTSSEWQRTTTDSSKYRFDVFATIVAQGNEAHIPPDEFASALQSGLDACDAEGGYPHGGVFNAIQHDSVRLTDGDDVAGGSHEPRSRVAATPNRRRRS